MGFTWGWDCEGQRSVDAPCLCVSLCLKSDTCQSTFQQWWSSFYNNNLSLQPSNANDWAMSYSFFIALLLALLFAITALLDVLVVLAPGLVLSLDVVSRFSSDRP